MNALTTVVIIIRNVNVGGFVGQFLNLFGQNFSLPSSAEIRLPGREVHRFPWSLTTDSSDIKEDSHALAGEHLDSETQFTRPQILEFSSVLARLTDIHERCLKYLRMAFDDYQRHATVSDDVHLNYWGPCKIAYQTECNILREDWFLRQRLENDNVVPLCRIGCDFGNIPMPEFVLSITIASTVWSRFEGFDNLTATPLTKRNLEAEFRNAEILADAIGVPILMNPNATIRWAIEREHQPDLSGFIPDALRARFGNEGMYHLISETAAYRRVVS